MASWLYQSVAIQKQTLSHSLKLLITVIQVAQCEHVTEMAHGVVAGSLAASTAAFEGPYNAPSPSQCSINCSQSQSQMSMSKSQSIILI